MRLRACLKVEKEMICNFYENIGRAKSDYGTDKEFKRANDIAMHRIDSAGDDDDSDSDETSSLDSSVKPVVVKEEEADVEEFADHGNELGDEDLLNSATIGLTAGVSDTGNGNDNNSAEKLQCLESDSSEVAKTKKKRRVKSTMKTPKAKRASVSSTVTPSFIQQSVDIS